jgi:integrase
MSIDVLSRKLSLADVRDAVRADGVLPMQRRQDLLSALNTCARVLGKPLDALPAAPRQIGALLAAARPAACDVSDRRWANVRSLVGQTLTLAGPLLPARHTIPLSAEWTALSAGLEPRFRRASIEPGLRCLSARQIGPSALTVEDLVGFLDEVRTNSLRRKPEDVCRRFIANWNHAVEHVPGWPQIRLEWESRRPVRHLPWSAYPASLEADVEAYLARQAGVDPMGMDGPPKPLRPKTLETYRGVLRNFAWSIVQSGVAPGSLRSLADLVSLPNFRAGFLDLWQRNGGETNQSSTLARRAHLLIGIARHYVGVNAASLAAMTKIAKRLEPEATGLTAKNRARLQPFQSEAVVRRFVNLPFVVQAEIKRGRMTPGRAAERAFAAAAIAILTVAPIRIKNLRDIEIGKHLRVHGDRLVLSFDEHEVKNAVHLSFEFERPTADLLRWYIDQHRPRLNPTGSAFLFPGLNGGPRSDCGMSAPIAKEMRKSLGLEVNPHLFRHISAKIFLDRHPGQWETVRQLLGHKSIATTMRFYAEFDRTVAAKLYQKVVTGLRASAGAP